MMGVWLVVPECPLDPCGLEALSGLMAPTREDLVEGALQLAATPPPRGNSDQGEGPDCCNWAEASRLPIVTALASAGMNFSRGFVPRSHL